MKLIKSLLILITLLVSSLSFSQNKNLGKVRTLKFTKQVDNKFVEIVFQAQPGDFLGGETYFKFKLEQIIIHQWEIDGKLYTSSNSQGILPANGKLGHIYLDVKIKTINNPFNEFWVKEGFQMNNMTDFQDIDYDGQTDNNWWINYAHVSDVTINSVYFANWFKIEKQLKALAGTNTSTKTNSNNQSPNKNTTVVSNQKKATNTSSQVQQVAKEMNLREDELKILKVISNTDNLNDALAKLNELGYQNFNKYTLDALNKLSSTIPNFPISPNEINTLLNGGNFKDIQKSYNLRQSTKVAQKLGLTNSQTELLNIISTSENNEEMNQRIKSKNIRDISNLSQNALNKVLGANNTIFPASSSDITAMINGNWKQALTNINNEIQVRNTMKNTGLDRQTAEGVNALGNVLINEIAKEFNRPKTPEELRLKFERKFQKQGSSSYWANDTLVMISSNKYGTKTVNYTKNGIGRTTIYNNDNIIIRENKTKSISFSKNNTIDKLVMINIDYEKQTKDEFTINGDFDIIKHVNLMTNNVIVDHTNATKTEEDLIDNGKKIGTKTLMNGKLFKISIPNKKAKTIKETSYHLGKKIRSQTSSTKYKTAKIPIKIIEFDNEENIKKKIEFNMEKNKATLTEIDYENGEAVREVKKINGKTIYDKMLE